MPGLGRNAAFCLAALALLAVSVLPLSAQSSSTKSSTPVWTEKPVKVDRKTQAYERVEPLSGAVRANGAKETDHEPDYPIHFPARTFFKVLDSVSFSKGGKNYRLADVSPIASARVCRTADGQRWACGARARAALSSLLTSRSLRCAEHGKDGTFVLVECLRSNMDVGAALVSAGLADGAPGADRYSVELAKARADKSGIWGDVKEPE